MNHNIRNALYFRLLAALNNGESAVVYGTRLSGRSSIVGRLQSEADRRLSPRLVVNGLERSAKPFQALRFALAGLGYDAAAADAGLFTSLRRFVEEDTGILVIENADRLDDGSLVMVEQLAQQLGRPCLVTTSLFDSQLSRAGVSAFSLAPRFELLPVDFEDAAALLSELLDGTPGTMETSRLLAKSGGIPGLLVAVANGAVRTGVMAKANGVWKFVRPFGAPVAANAALCLLDGLTVKETEDLTRLALLGPVDGEVVEQITTPEHLVRLERSGLLYRNAEGDAERFRVNVQPEILAVHLRESVGLFQRRRLFAGLVEGRPNLLTQQESFVYEEEQTSVSAALSSETSSSDLAAAMQHTTRALLGVHLEQWQRHRSTSEAIDLLDLMVERGHSSAEIRLLLDQMCQMPTENVRDKVVLFLRIARWRAWMDKDLDGAIGSLNELRKETGAESELTRVIGAAIDHLRTVGGVATQPDESWPVFLNLEHPTVTRALVAISHGRHTEGAAALERDSVTFESSTNLATFVRQLSLLRTGALDDAIRFGRNALAAAVRRQDSEAVVLTSNALATAQIFLGRLNDANKTLTDSLALGGTAFPYTPVHVSNLVMLAILQARRGMRSRALTTFNQTTSFGVEYAPFAFAAPELALAFIDYFDDKPSAGDRIWKVCAELIQRGYTSAAISAWAFAGPWSEEQNAAIAGVIPSDAEPLFGPVLRLHEAISTNRRELLEESYLELVAQGRNLFAAGAAIQRSRLSYNDRDDYRAWTEKAQELTRSIGLPSYEALLLPVRMKRLSSREREVFDLLAIGESNQVIANRLVLTVRTVENHVFRVLKKLDLRSRLEIVRFSSELML